MITISFEGMEEVIGALDRIASVAGGDWKGPLGALGERVRRYAASISPVITGSYRDAHRFAMSYRQAEVSIDPSARNTASGVLVSSYAQPVEDRHRVYGRTFDQVGRLAVQVEQELFEEMGL